MKFHFFLFAMFSFSSVIAQENLVANGSFEDYSTCPDGIGQITNATGWMSFRQSPDYFNECATDTLVTIPKNLFGYQSPFDGIAYAGVITWRITEPEANEMLSTELVQPVEMGSLYFISFRACLAINNGNVCLAANHIGAKFANHEYSESSPMPIDNNPAIDYPFFITDTVNWTQVSGWYVPDSNYTYLVIANFYKGNLTDTIHMTNYSNPGYAYYYIDSVSVVKSVGDGSPSAKKVSPQLMGVPANDYCIASFGTERINTIEVSNLLSEQVGLINTLAGDDKMRIGTSVFPSGTYTVKLHGDEKDWTFILIVQH